MPRVFQYLEKPSDLIRHFTPNWFTVCMGTGIVALIISELPMFSDVFWNIGQTLWHINIFLFAACSVLYMARWALFYHEAKQVFQHPMMCLFLGAIPMALATLINGMLKYGVPLYGEHLIDWAQQLWWLDVALAVTIAWIIPFCMYRHQQHSLKNMTAVWLLPIVACEVAAASGGVLIAQLEAGQAAMQILLTSYVLWGMSVLPAFAVLTILMLRLALQQLPAKEVGLSSWLTLGPIGTGALALLLLGHEAPRLMSFIGWGQLGELMQGAGILGSLILLGFAVWWLGIALLSSVHHLQQDLPFNLGWWALTFPIGVLSLAVLTLAKTLGLAWMLSIGYSLTVLLILLWCIVAFKTVIGFYQGKLLFSPCLVQFLEKQSSVKS